MIKIFLFLSLNLFAQFKFIHETTYSLLSPPLCCGGTKGTHNNGDAGKAATGFGSGGGSSGWGGGWGGNGLHGGGGGGAASYQSSYQGGTGGKGAIVLEYRTPEGSPIFSEIRVNNFSNILIPANVGVIKVWVIGGGGGGAGGYNNDGTSSSGGAAGGTAYKTFLANAASRISGVVGASGNPGPGGGGAGGGGGQSSFTLDANPAITANGGDGGLFNNGGARNGGSCSQPPTSDGCVQGGSAYGVTGDNPGSPGGAIGRANQTKGYDGDVDNGEDGNNAIDVSGLFRAVTFARTII